MKYLSGGSVLLLAFLMLSAFERQIFVGAALEEQSGDGGVREVTVQYNEDNSQASSITAEQTRATATIADELITEKPVEICQCNCWNDDSDSTTLSPEVDTTTNTSDGNFETTISAQDSNESTGTAATPTEPPFTCPQVGSFAHPDDCRRFYTCSPNAEAGSFAAIENTCPMGKAFSVEFSACMRDLSPCGNEVESFQCSQAGTFADPQNATKQYYRCAPRLDTAEAAFHKYLIKCAEGKIFMPLLGQCFLDYNNQNNLPQPGFGYNKNMDDEQIVKVELKQWKIFEKAKLKTEKQRLKSEQKLQKELEKKANKAAKNKSISAEESKEILL